jgi:multiple sugar transport system permease protein
LWRITIPALRRSLVLVIMLQTAAQLQLFGQSQLLTAGGPSGASRTAVLFLFETAFARWELGYASAAAEALFLIILAITFAQYWATGRGQGSR